jgi:peptide-methionine (S)-S-oxide reductase
METLPKLETAIFGGGCFWCTEAIFRMLKGVASVAPGYAGGEVVNPTYEQVCGGNTSHAEVIKIDYDPTQVPYTTLLTVFFASHDPTTLNRQGADVGTQYRSIILTTAEAQKKGAENFITELNASSTEGATVVTEVKPLETFYPAEEKHFNYYEQNKNRGYCQLVINPKLEKVQKQFAELLKTNSQSDA